MINSHSSDANPLSGLLCRRRAPAGSRRRVGCGEGSITVQGVLTMMPPVRETNGGYTRIAGQRQGDTGSRQHDDLVPPLCSLALALQVVAPQRFGSHQHGIRDASAALGGESETLLPPARDCGAR